MRGLDKSALRNARERRGLSQTRLALIMGHEPATAHRWESGEREPDTLADFKVLCDVLGVSADVLLGREKFPSARYIADIIREAGTTDADELAKVLHKRLTELIGDLR